MKTKYEQRQRRRFAVRNRLRDAGVRLTVSRSSKHISAQVIDLSGRTLCGVSSTKKALGTEFAGKTKTERAALIGREIAKLAREKGVETVVFDKGRLRVDGPADFLADVTVERARRFGSQPIRQETAHQPAPYPHDLLPSSQARGKARLVARILSKAQPVFLALRDVTEAVDGDVGVLQRHALGLISILDDLILLG